MRLQKKKYVNPRFARQGEYGQVISKIVGEGHCPFCPQNFRYHKHPVLKTRGDWFITRSSWPYENTRHHFLLIGKGHKEQFAGLSVQDFERVRFLVRWACKEFDIEGGSLALRFGNTDWTGSTVAHLHFHLIVPKMVRGKALPVIFPIG